MSLVHTQKVQNLNFKFTSKHIGFRSNIFSFWLWIWCICKYNISETYQFLMRQKANFWLAHRTKLKFYQGVDFRGMGHVSRKNVDVTFLYCLFLRFFYQPIRCTDLIEVKNYFFTSFNRLCQVPAYLLCGSALKYDIQSARKCKNRDQHRVYLKVGTHSI